MPAPATTLSSRTPSLQSGLGVSGPGPALPAHIYRVLFLLFFSLFPQLQAHHGRDFIFIQDSAIPAPFSGVALAGFEWSREGSRSEFSSEPGFYMGLTPSLAFGLTAGFRDEEDGWAYSGFTPQFVLSLLPATGPMNFRMGLWTGYEFADDSASDQSASSSDQQNQHHEESPPEVVPLHLTSGGAAGGPGAVTHLSRGGIHRHGESGWYSRLIMEADISHHTRLVLNLVSFVSGESGRPGFGYAAGIRHEFTHDLSLGLEAIGDFRSYRSSHQLLATAMIGLPGHLSLRLGFGGGLTQASPDFILHSSLMWRF